VDAANVPFERCSNVVSHSSNQANQIGIPLGNGGQKKFNSRLVAPKLVTEGGSGELLPEIESQPTQFCL
jgi:hypothetical protein